MITTDLTKTKVGDTIIDYSYGWESWTTKIVTRTDNTYVYVGSPDDEFHKRWVFRKDGKGDYGRNRFATCEPEDIVILEAKRIRRVLIENIRHHLYRIEKLPDSDLLELKAILDRNHS